MYLELVLLVSPLKAEPMESVLVLGLVLLVLQLPLIFVSERLAFPLKGLNVLLSILTMWASWELLLDLVVDLQASQ